MERKIAWQAECFEAMKKVYEKAEKSENAQKILADMENGALEESRANCSLIGTADGDLTPEQYDAMEETAKEEVIALLGSLGLTQINVPEDEAKITVKFSKYAEKALCCTMFSVINCLQQLDGTYNIMFFPQATMEIETPLNNDARQNEFTQLIRELYPWIREVELYLDESAGKKKGFFARLFGK